jgi:hypothetical protein
MFRKQILNFLDTKKPAAVISLSDLSIGDRIIFSWCKRKNVPFIILQPSVVEAKIESYRELSVKRLLRYVLFNVFLSSPLYSRQNLYANEAKKVTSYSGVNIYYWIEPEKECILSAILLLISFSRIFRRKGNW